jgi:hypothetical protein
MLPLFHSKERFGFLTVFVSRSDKVDTRSFSCPRLRLANKPIPRADQLEFNFYPQLLASILLLSVESFIFPMFELQ